MAIIETFAPTFLDRVAATLSNVFSSRRDLPDESDMPHSDFVQDMISRNADYFSSDYDVQAMMSYYPRDF